MTKERANAWTVADEKKAAQSQNVVPSTGKVDTRRLEYFSDVESLRYLLKHPLMTAFLEMELSSLKFRYFLDFLVYLTFVVFLFLHLGNRYGFMKVEKTEEAWIFEIDGLGKITYYILILFIFILLLIIREIYEIIMQKKRYFYALENYIEWFVLAMASISILPKQLYKDSLGDEALR